MKHCLLVLIVFLTACTTTRDQHTPSAQQLTKAAESYYLLGVNYLEKKLYPLAELKLKRSLKVSPTAQAYNALALTYEAQQKNQLALSTYRQLIAQFPDSPRGYLNYHVFLCKNNKHKEKQQLYSQMMRENSGLIATAHIAMGHCALKNGKVIVAKNYYATALLYQPAATSALLSLAEIAWRQGELQEAEGYLKTAQQQTGDSARLLYLSAEIQSALGNDATATHIKRQLKNRYAGSQEAQALLLTP